MPDKPENRVDRIVTDLLRGRRLKLRAGDADEKEAITIAARLAAARQGTQRMSPAFRNRLAAELQSAPKELWFTRRAALVAGLGVAAGAVTGGLIGKAIQAATPAQVAGGGLIIPEPGKWVDVGALNDFAEGQGKRVTAGAIGAFLFRRGEAVTAVSSICSHLPCELWWNADGHSLDCPCHPAQFQPDGTPAHQGYGLAALNRVSVRVTTAGRVEVLGT
jgi:quinol---cytochrome c reductase iron-sulfur subunit, bacillus type